MIIREKGNHIVCIEQHHHGYVAEQLITGWIDLLLQDSEYRDTILYAIKYHDVGWDYFDRQPLWNDATNLPYTFIDMPLLIKTVLYSHGVDIVAKHNRYAAVLCSAHYTKFLQSHSLTEINQYLTNEQARRDELLSYYPHIKAEMFQQHLGILQFADNLSLFVCLHEPGNNTERHRYFQHGIPIPKVLTNHEKETLHPTWLDEQTLLFEHKLNSEPLANTSITIREKIIAMDDITNGGFIHSYETTPFKKRTIQIVYKHKSD